MWPAIAAIAGAAIGALSQQKANRDNEQTQREFAQSGIRWRVEDAKAAGLHPLYAIGGSGATYTPSAQPVFNGAELGQNLSRAASAFSSSSEQQLKAANLKALEAQADRDFAAAQAYRSEAARLGQSQTPPVSQEDLDWFAAKGMGNPLVAQSFAVPNPDAQVRPLDPAPPAYLEAGVKPGFQRYVTPIAGEVILPSSSSMSEAVEALENPALQIWVIAENVKHYGPGAERKLRALLGHRYKWWTNPGGALKDAVRAFGRDRAALGGN